MAQTTPGINNADNKLNAYNLLYAKPAYGLAVPIGTTKIISFNPYHKNKPCSKAKHSGTGIISVKK